MSGQFLCRNGAWMGDAGSCQVTQQPIFNNYCGQTATVGSPAPNGTAGTYNGGSTMQYSSSWTCPQGNIPEQNYYVGMLVTCDQAPNLYWDDATQTCVSTPPDGSGGSGGSSGAAASTSTSAAGQTSYTAPASSACACSKSGLPWWAWLLAGGAVGYYASNSKGRRN